MRAPATKRQRKINAARLDFNRSWSALAGLFLLSVLLFYLPSLNLGLYADDYHSWTNVERYSGLPAGELLFKTYNPEFYRPFEFMLIRANEMLFGYKPILYRSAAVFGHLLTCLAVFILAARLKLGRAAGLAAAIFFAVHPTNAMAAFSNDAANQIYCTLFGLASLIALVPAEQERKTAETIAASALLLLSMLWKDAGTSYLVMGFFVIAASPAALKNKRQSAFAAAGLLAAFLLYLAIRSHAGVVKPVVGYQYRYELWLGKNLAVNPALMIFSLFSPVGSTLLSSAGAYRFAAVALTGVLGLLLFAMIVLGQLRIVKTDAEGRRTVPVLLGLFALSFLPDVLMVHVSELYTYKPAAFLSILFGGSVTHLLTAERPAGTKQRDAVLFLCAAVIIVFSVSTKQKEWIMRANAERCDAYLAAVQEQVPTIRPPTSVIMANDFIGPKPYSIFEMPGVHVFGGTHALEKLYGMKMPVYLIVEKEQIDSTCVTLKTDCLKILAREDGSIKAELLPPK